MQYRAFADTDIMLSELTFGTMRYVSGLYEGDETEGKRALEEALASGVNAIHSSYEYGTRWATGDVLKAHPKRHEIHHIIKAPVPDYDDADFDPAKFRRLVEDALRELHAERISIVQHLQRGVDKAIIYDERGDPARIAAMPAVNERLQAAFEDLRAEGKVGALACFPHTPGFAAAAVASGAFQRLVAFFSLVETELVPLFDDMRDRGMSFVTMRSLLQGLLSNKRARRADLAADDPKRGPEWDVPYRRFERIQEALGTDVRSWSELAVKFALSDPLFPSVIISTNTVDQLRGVLAAADGTYPGPELISRIHALNTSDGA
ncbi:MAG: aldo/keto reductase [Alphaproteobacteria bacterium]